MTAFTRHVPAALLPRSLTTRTVIAAGMALMLGLAIAATQWTLEPKQSKLAFVGTQAGAEFEGKFEKFTADIKFDPKDLAGSRFDVKIDMNSVNSQDEERDATLQTDDLFNTKRWPTSHYLAESFKDLGGGKFSATGKLTIRDITRPVPLEFTFQDKNGTAWLKGSTKIKRIDFGVGQNDWQDTSTVANDVQVKFELMLKK